MDTTAKDSVCPVSVLNVSHDISSQDIEEGRDVYHLGGFHPVYIGDVYHDRYEVLNKVGYGAYSTVWLARDLKASLVTDGDAQEFVALKFLTAEAYDTEKDIFERDILKHLRAQDKEQLGYAQICHLVDDFEHKGPNGTHVCLVFELIGETLRSFGAWFPESMIPNEVMRRFTIQLLLALHFAHNHNVIHTDIQPSNIFVKIRDYTLIESSYLVNASIPQQDKTEKQYTVIRSRALRRYYFNNDDRIDQFDIVLGDWGVASWADNHLAEMIQPLALRAPEVLIGAPWDAAADLWNVGAVVLEMFRAIRMFSGEYPQGHYELKQHLAEIVLLCGQFPKALLEKASQDIVGDIFDEQGKVNDSQLSPDKPILSSEEYTPGLEEDDREEFVSFLQSLMKIDPVERPSPEDLLRGRWLYALPSL